MRIAVLILILLGLSQFVAAAPYQQPSEDKDHGRHQASGRRSFSHSAPVQKRVLGLNTLGEAWNGINSGANRLASWIKGPPTITLGERRGITNGFGFFKPKPKIPSAMPSETPATPRTVQTHAESPTSPRVQPLPEAEVSAVDAERQPGRFAKAKEWYSKRPKWQRNGMLISGSLAVGAAIGTGLGFATSDGYRRRKRDGLSDTAEQSVPLHKRALGLNTMGETWNGVSSSASRLFGGTRWMKASPKPQTGTLGETTMFSTQVESSTTPLLRAQADPESSTSPLLRPHAGPPTSPSTQPFAETKVSAVNAPKLDADGNPIRGEIVPVVEPVGKSPSFLSNWWDSQSSQIQNWTAKAALAGILATPMAVGLAAEFA